MTQENVPANQERKSDRILPLPTSKPIIVDTSTEEFQREFEEFQEAARKIHEADLFFSRWRLARGW